MKILVTGANGYLGRGVVSTLLDHGCEVIAASRSLDNVDIRAKKVQCDIFNVDNPFEYFERPNTLLHMAWQDGFAHYSDYHIKNLYEHYSFIKNFVESGCKKIAVLGSMHEIGFFEGCIKDNTPCNPTTPYGIAKNALRELTFELCSKNRCIVQWLRGFYIVGNTKYGSSIFSKIVLANEKGEKLFPFTLGQNQYDFIDYDDFCTQVSVAVAQDSEQGIINLCSGRPEKLADRVERFIKENNFSIKLNYGAFPDRPYDSKAIWGDNTKIKKILKSI